MARLFGTDGVRGVANGDLTAELALGLSVAAAHVLGEVGAFDGRRPVAISTWSTSSVLSSCSVMRMEPSGCRSRRLSVVFIRMSMPLSR